MQEQHDTKKRIIGKLLTAIEQKAENVDMFTNIRDLATAYGVLIDKELKFAEIGIGDEKDTDSRFVIDPLMVADGFHRVRRDVLGREHTEYVLPGGRGSTKSSFVSLMLLELIMNNPEIHALAARQVAATLKDSVYAQIQWAICECGLEKDFQFKVNPLEITRKKTGQKIYFRGADDPVKLKSIKPPFGHIGVLWMEELDQFRGPAAVRSVEQSVIRGGDIAWIFKTYNTPKTKDNWVNKAEQIPDENRLMFHTTYETALVPREWLGSKFIERAEHLRKTQFSAWEHEYGGVANGTGGMIFENVNLRAITDDEIRRFDRIYNGVDWGFYPDPWAFNRCHFEASTRRLYIFDEGHEYKKIPAETGKIVARKTRPKEKITCDSSPPENTHDYMRQGLVANRAIKGPGSVERRHVWLQGLTEIIIDPARCPFTAEEFTNYEHDKDQDGNIIGGYPDRDNHHIDAVCYGTEDLWHIAEQRGKSLTDYL